MLNEKKVSTQIDTLKKFVQDENKKNGRIDDQAQKKYENFTLGLSKEESIIIPLYAPRYILSLGYKSIFVIDLLEIQSLQAMDYDKLSMFRNEDGDVQIISVCYSFCISEDDANKIITADIKSSESKKAS